MAEIPNNKDKRKKIIPKPPQKPNYQVWVIIAIITVVFGISIFGGSNSAIQISEKRFERMF